MAQIFQHPYRLVDQQTQDTKMLSTHLLILPPVRISPHTISIHIKLTPEQYSWTNIIMLMSTYHGYRYSFPST